MDQTTLEILLKLKDEASAAFQSAAEKMTTSGGGISKVLNTNVDSFVKWGAAAGVAATGLIVAFGVSAIRAYDDAQIALTRVDATLKAMGENAVKNKNAILESASAATRLGFDDEAAAESITRFYQATGSLTEATKLNNLAMDLARAKNLDLATATQLVNMVLGGNGRALKQYQINLKDSATPLEALAELQSKVAGQSEAYAQTFPGQIAVITQAWTNMKEEIGKVLADALTPFVKQFSDWLLNPKTQESFKKWTIEFQSWADVIIPTIIETFRIWATVLETIFDWLIKIGDAILKAIDLFKQFDKISHGLGSGAANVATGGLFGLMKSGLGALGFAEGGIVTRPTFAMIGEGGGPEAVIPLNKLAGMGMGGGVIVNMSGNFYGTDQEMARKFGDMIAGVISQQLKIRTI